MMTEKKAEELVANHFMEDGVHSDSEPTTVIDESTQVTILIEKDSISYNLMGEEGSVVGNDIEALRYVIDAITNTGIQTKGYKIVDKR
jgi:fructose-1,6-bisphosphatase/inositol monophosphatase family enzyme